MANRKRRKRLRTARLHRRSVAAVEELTTRTYEVRAASIDEQSRSVKAVLATENPVQVFDWNRGEIIDEVLRMDGADLPNQLPLLDSHSRYSVASVLGSTRDLRVSGDQLLGRNVFASDPESDRAWTKVREGHIRDNSIGYRIAESVTIPPGEKAVVRGRQYQAPSNRALRVTTRWQPKENSIVPIGADELAQMRQHAQSAARTAQMKEQAMDELKKWLAERGWTIEAFRSWAAERLESDASLDDLVTDEKRATELDELKRGFAAAQDTEREPLADPAESREPYFTADDLARAAREATRQAIAAERERVAAIRKEGAGLPPELVQRAIDEQMTLDQARALFLAELRTRTPSVGAGPAVIVRDADRDVTQRAVAAGMLMRAGLNPIDSDVPESVRRQQERAAEIGYRFRDLSMLDVCREALRLSRIELPHSRDEQIRAAVSTSALSNIFTTVVNAQLIRAYEEAGDTTVGWVRETEVPDFKSNERTRLSALGGLERLPRGGTAEHTSAADQKEEYKVARYAKQFVVDEQDIIDDAFNALLDMPQMMGSAARRLRPDLVYYLLLANAALDADSTALFHANHSNLGTAGTALAASTLEAGVVAMAKQKDGSAQLNLLAKFLLVPQDLRFTAKILLKSAERIISANSGGTLNPLIDEDIALRSDNRLGVAGVTDPATGTAIAGTATNWFLVCSPAQAPMIEVGYLRGTGRSPVIRAFTLDKGQWGVGWDVKMDIGVKALDYRGLYKATGAS